MEEKIKEQLVTFKTAKLAKKNGFELETLSNQAHNSFDKLGNELGDSGFVTKFFYCWQPSQSLLQRWLRERHKLFVTVNTFGDEKDYPRYMYEIIDLNDYMSPVTNQLNSLQQKGTYKQLLKKTFIEYEDAFEAGLQRALKLIKL